MHYTGMSALRVKGGFTYDTPLVVLSVVIAVVAATAALWFAIFLTAWCCGWPPGS